MPLEMNPDTLHAECLTAAVAASEQSDCAVRALAITTGEGYAMSHYALEDCGREHRGPSSIIEMEQAAIALGYRMVQVEHSAYDDRAKTAITAERLGWKGAFILSFSGHAAAMVDGEVFDWVQGCRNRILDIYRIIEDN